MSTVSVCDGCGAREGEMEPRGHVVCLDYCEKCLAVVDAHAHALRELQAEIAGLYEQRKAEIEAEALRACPGMKLPL